MGDLLEYLRIQIYIRKLNNNIFLLRKQEIEGFDDDNDINLIKDKINYNITEIDKFTSIKLFHIDYFKDLIDRYIDSLKSYFDEFDYSMEFNDIRYHNNRFLSDIIGNKSIIMIELYENKFFDVNIFIDYLMDVIKNKNIVPIKLNMYKKKINDPISFFKQYIHREIGMETDDVGFFIERIYDEEDDLDFLYDIYFIFYNIEEMINLKESLSKMINFIENINIPCLVFYDKKIYDYLSNYKSYKIIEFIEHNNR